MKAALPKIEKNIPVPSSGKARATYTSVLQQMQIGDSFLVEKSKFPNVYQCARFCGVPIVSRAEGDMRRVWRMDGCSTKGGRQ